MLEEGLGGKSSRRYRSDRYWLFDTSVRLLCILQPELPARTSMLLINLTC